MRLLADGNTKGSPFHVLSFMAEIDLDVEEAHNNAK